MWPEQLDYSRGECLAILRGLGKISSVNVVGPNLFVSDLYRYLNLTYLQSFNIICQKHFFII
jgi:hypothetical protein